MAAKEIHDKDKTGWGGRRKGAGRPSNDSKLYTFRAPGPIARVIDAQENKTGFVRRCIMRCISEDIGLRRFGQVYSPAEIEDISLPFFDISVVAGFPVPLDTDERAQSIGLLRLLCPNEESSYLIRVKGSSMIDANIHDGDLVIVDKSNRDPSEHEVAVCEFNGEYTLKRFVRRGSEGWLVPANPDFPEIKVTPDDDFSIWGVVRYVIHKPTV